MVWEPKTGVLWTVVNERDELGSDLVPDYLTSVVEGGFYGWPYSYWGRHVDTRVEPPRPDLVARAIKPDYALGAHVAPLGLATSVGAKLPPNYSSGMFIGEHGSWNRRPLSGYAVVFVPFRNGKPAGMPTEVLTGFVNAEGDAYGRPVGVMVDKAGGLLVADDVGNTIWRVTSAGTATASAASQPGRYRCYVFRNDVSANERFGGRLPFPPLDPGVLRGEERHTQEELLELCRVPVSASRQRARGLQADRSSAASQ